ncbi:FAD-dependent monooxygenase [Actinoalloteichus hymeniacidonis]|uniref:2-polyprenyl-6-methoxyphenol hydroxylase-like oxidoreductase n=1 Tax=Actinoalloteichus hymeniacidonis TaxID=340345 RepID=A0AAC9HQZ4_9PSEU|nr:FAD-dependent monooxygenase [Actinoalloteichus hymeniacidonis]AOS63934.1 2-polyprenyl-6-methoxyphenol hydroxylase-like oxidoreductase [Actinoalloteichus hymeniacidonis]MBB5908009.1 aklavinone 12-hydroxylase [Actinoalloteichus hymeniacidonis]
MNKVSNERVPVLIVGGAYTGLSTALGLAHHGVKPLLVERRPTTSTLPKAWGLNPRTMELLDTIPGVGADVRAAMGNGTMPAVRSGASVRVATQPEIDPTPFIAAYQAMTAAPVCFLPQSTIEKILRSRAEDLGADLRFGTELVSWTQDDDAVTATLRDVSSGHEYTVQADYLVAADGNTSPIRTSLGIPLEGGGRVGHVYVITFEADLTSYFTPGHFVVVGIPGSGTSVIHDSFGVTTLWVDYFPEEGQSEADFTEEKCLERVRNAIGVPDLECRIANARPFPLNHQLAERFVDGRVILAGDAAHACPPVGGQGGNLAIQDGYDVAWRLALILTGQAGPALLDTYPQERRPVINITLEREVALLGVAEGRILSTFDESQPIPTLREQLGFRYHSPAVRTEPGDDMSLQEDPAAPTGRPGTRAPHVRLTLDGETLSTHDLFGKEFVLLTGDDGAEWVDAAAKVADRFGVGLVSRQIGVRFVDADNVWRSRYGIESAGAALVRPDAVIAWRCKDAADDPERELAEALTAVLAR